MVTVAKKRIGIGKNLVTVATSLDNIACCDYQPIAPDKAIWVVGACNKPSVPGALTAHAAPKEKG